MRANFPSIKLHIEAATIFHLLTKAKTDYELYSEQDRTKYPKTVCPQWEIIGQNIQYQISVYTRELDFLIYLTDISNTWQGSEVTVISLRKLTFQITSTFHNLDSRDEGGFLLWHPIRGNPGRFSWRNGSGFCRRNITWALIATLLLDRLFDNNWNAKKQFIPSPILLSSARHKGLSNKEQRSNLRGNVGLPFRILPTFRITRFEQSQALICQESKNDSNRFYCNSTGDVSTYWNHTNCDCHTPYDF